MMIAQMAFAALASSAQAKNQAKLSQMEMDAAAANNAAAQTELTREQNETNRVSGEEKSDRQRAFEKDLGAIRVASAEGFGMGDRFAQQSGYIFGTDLSRIESNRKGQIASLQAKKNAVRADSVNAINAAHNKSEVANTNFVYQTLGSGLQIASEHQYRQTQTEVLKNQRSGSSYP